MEDVKKNSVGETKLINRISLKSGIFTALGLILYFLSMRLFNLHYVVMLHYLNILILFFGLRYAIKHIRSMSGEIKYFEGLKAGVIVSILSLFIFNIFMAIYATIINPPFLEFLAEKISPGGLFSKNETIGHVIGIITVEGLSSGFIMTFALMQYYKSETSETI